MYNRGLLFLNICLMLLLAACGTMNPERDGPPAHDVDVSRIPNAVPKNEALSYYANQPYSIRGKRYKVLKTASGYRERGIASWYGTKFHQKRTSSGERYNMFAMTAASRTLPIPSYVQVTNLNNGKNIIVKVNDRGPFQKNRLIDLSYVAAKKLDVTRTGTALVEVRAIQTQRTHIFGKKTHINNDVIYLQVAALKNRNNANKLRIKIAKIVGMPVRVQQIKTRHKLAYRIQIGPLEDKNASKKVMHRLAKAGVNKVTVVIV